MKERVAAAGLRVPRSARVRTAAEAREAAARARLSARAQADLGRRQRRHLPGRQRARARGTRWRGCSTSREASIEEFIDGEEFTFDTRVHRRQAGVRERRAVPAQAADRAHQRVDQPGDHRPCATSRSPRSPTGIALGHGVLGRARHGRRLHPHGVVPASPSGEVVFGEIGCRPGGAHLVDQMNYTCDIDLFREWARAVCWHRSRRRRARKYNAAIIFKRARGQGRITQIIGLARVHAQVRRVRRRGEAAAARCAASQLEAHAAQRRLHHLAPPRLGAPRISSLTSLPTRSRCTRSSAGYFFAGLSLVAGFSIWSLVSGSSSSGSGS